MRLLFISQDFPPDIGGIQTYSWELVRRLHHLGIMADVIAPARADHEVVDRGLQPRVHRLSARPDLLPLAALQFVPRLARRIRPDASFHTQWQTAGAAIVSRRLTGYPKRIAIAAHGRELLFSPFSVRRLTQRYDSLRRLILRHADLVLPVSHYTAGLVADIGVDPGRIRILHNGTDPERFAPADGKAFREEVDAGQRPLILSVGRLVPRKGIDTVISALPEVRRQVPHVLFVVAGDGPDRERLMKLARHHGVDEAVRFVGRVPYEKLATVYSAADVVAMPSRDDPPDVEGFGIVFLEANACGRAVVGASSGGIPDAIINGETGLIVPPDSPKQLAGALGRLLSDADFRNQLGERGRQRVVSDLSWDHVAERLAQHLLTLTNGGTK